MPYVAGRYAAIDIGTVTCRLLVADVDESGAISELRRQRAIANLGAGVDATGRLSADAVERVGTAVDGFASALAEVRGQGAPIALTAVATSAARDASNSGELKRRLARAGIGLQIIPGEREAELSFAGASAVVSEDAPESRGAVGAPSPSEGSPRIAVIDAGGGSTEVICGYADGNVERAHSFQIGCRRITERFFDDDPPLPGQLDAARRWIADEISGYIGAIADEGWFLGDVVAVAGTATSVISVRDAMDPYDPVRVHGALATRAEVDGLVERLAALPLARRRAVVGLDPGRAPVIVGGLLILQTFMEVADIPSFIASESDILQGIILDAASMREHERVVK